MELRRHRAQRPASAARFDRLNLIFRETEDLYNRSVLTEPLSELRNLIACAYLIIKMARARRQNVGLHYSLDLV